MRGKKKVKSKKVERRKKHEVSNVFEELGLDKPDELMVRTKLLNQVSSLIGDSGLSQQEVAEKLGIAQSQVSLLVGGRLSAFSTDTLLRYLSILGCNVQIKVKRPRSRIGIFRDKGHIGVR